MDNDGSGRNGVYGVSNEGEVTTPRPMMKNAAKRGGARRSNPSPKITKSHRKQMHRSNSATGARPVAKKQKGMDSTFTRASIEAGAVDVTMKSIDMDLKPTGSSSNEVLKSVEGEDEDEEMIDASMFLTNDFGDREVSCDPCPPKLEIDTDYSALDSIQPVKKLDSKLCPRHLYVSSRGKSSYHMKGKSTSRYHPDGDDDC